MTQAQGWKMVFTATPVWKIITPSVTIVASMYAGKISLRLTAIPTAKNAPKKDNRRYVKMKLSVY
jgi:hypothetical protein